MPSVGGTPTAEEQAAVEEMLRAEEARELEETLQRVKIEEEELRLRAATEEAAEREGRKQAAAAASVIAEFQARQRELNREASADAKPIKSKATFDNFDGTGGAKSLELPRWMESTRRKLELYYCDLSEARQVLLAADALKGAAQVWWEEHAREVKRGGAELLLTLDELEAALEKAFPPINVRRRARDRWAELRQTGSVVDYAMRLRTIVQDMPGVTEEEKMDKFERGLKEHLRMDLQREQHNLKTLADMIELADNLEKRVYSRRDSSYRRPFNPPRYPVQRFGAMMSGVKPPPSRMNTGRSTMKPWKPNPSRGSPRPPTTERAGGERTSNDNRCFYCNAPGHRAFECRKKAQDLERERGSHASSGQPRGLARPSN